MLQPLASQSCSTGRAADQEPPGLQVSAGPDEITDALETEHRVVDIERNRWHVMVAVRGAGSQPGTKRPGLVDSFLKNLAFLVFAVIHQLVGILRRVQLPFRRIDSNLAEHALHAKCSGLVRHDGHNVLANTFVANQRCKDSNECHCGRCFALPSAFQLSLERLQWWRFQRCRFGAACGRNPPSSLPALMHVFDFETVGIRLAVRNSLDILVVDRNIEAISELHQRINVKFLLLMRNVLSLARRAHAESLDGFGKNNARLARVIHCVLVGRIHFS